MHSLPVNIQWFWRFLAGMWDQGHLTEITGPTLCKGPINLGLSICTSIFYHSIFLRICSSVFFIFYMLRDRKYSKLMNWWSRIFGKNSGLCKNGPKRPKMVLFIFLSITAVFFSHKWLSRFSSYFAWSWGTITTQTEGAKFFEKILACLKTGQNDPKHPDLSVFLLRQELASLPYIFAIWLFLVNSLPSFSKNNCDNFFQHS